MLTDSENLKHTKRNRNRAIDAKGKYWSDKQKVEAVTHYIMVGGNLAMTARNLNIPEITLKMWKASKWWKELESEMRKQERMELSTKLKNIMDSSMMVLTDRLERGDWIYDQKTGQLLRKPVSMKDAGKIAMDAANLRHKMDIAEQHAVTAVVIEEQMTKIAESFAQFAKGTYKPPQELEIIDAVEIFSEENQEKEQ